MDLNQGLFLKQGLLEVESTEKDWTWAILYSYEQDKSKTQLVLIPSEVFNWYVNFDITLEDVEKSAIRSYTINDLITLVDEAEEINRGLRDAFKYNTYSNKTCGPALSKKFYEILNKNIQNDR